MSNQRAIIYCRVSHSKQSKAHVGSGLDSQEHRCRAYAANKGYIVEAVFPDDVSAGGDFMARPGMAALLAYLEARPEHNFVVIFDDLKRFSRDTIFHWGLRNQLAAYGASVECLNFTFEDTPEGEFVETIVAAQGQLERKQNQRQTIQKMKACLERGHWPFQPPIGYKRRRERGQSKMLVRDEPVASIIEQALNLYANGTLQLQAEVKRYLEAQPEFPKDLPGGGIRGQKVKDILNRVLYAGYLEHEPWGVSLRPAQHEGIISYETHLKIKERLKGRSYAPARKDLNRDFVLRGFVYCDCGTPLTACWSKGGSGNRHAYYHCPKSGCEHYGKSIRRADLEGEFEELLKTLQPRRELHQVACVMFEELWADQVQRQEAMRQSLEQQRAEAKKEVERLLERIVDADSATVIRAFEHKIDSIEKELLVFDEKLANCGKPAREPGRSLRTALEFIGKPYDIWASGVFENQRTVLKFAFTRGIEYVRGEGLRTPEESDFSLPFQVIKKVGEGQNMGKCEMARLARFERATAWFVAQQMKFNVLF